MIFFRNVTGLKSISLLLILVFSILVGSGCGNLDVTVNRGKTSSDSKVDEIGFTMPQISVTEGTGAGTIQVSFNVALSNPATKRVLINYSALDGSANGGSDFVASAGTLIIEPGASSASFSIDIIKDSLVEGPETFTVKLLPTESYGTPGNLKMIVTIVDDDVAATVTNVTSAKANGVYSVGTVIPIAVQFSQAVIVSGTPQLDLNLSPLGQTASYVSGSGTNTLVFDYTVAAGDSITDLDYASISALTALGGSIKDTSGNDANLVLPFMGLPGSLGTNKNIAIDTQAPGVPTLQISDPITASSTYVSQSSVNSVITNDAEAANYWWVDQPSADPAPSVPLVTSPQWTTKPTTITLSGAGNRTVYLYVKDIAGNISASAATASIYYSVPDHIEILGGDNQTGVVTSTLGTALQLKVVDASGVQSPGVDLTFTPSAGSLSATAVTTNSSGTASVSFTLGTVAGVQTVSVGRTTTVLPDSAATGRATVTFSATANTDVPDHINIIQGDSQSQTVGSALATQPSVAVVDKYDNGVSGVQLVFTLSQGQGWLDFGKVLPGLVMTDSSGQASIDFKVGFNSITSVIAVQPLSIILPDVNLTGRTSVRFTTTSSSSNAVYPFKSLDGGVAGVANALSLVAFDANGDGLPDIVSSNSGSSNIALYLNSASGFLPKTSLPTTSGTSRYAISSGDFNGDGNTDIVYGSTFGGTGIYIQLSNGAGGFSAESGKSLPSGGYAASIVTADLNGDGKLDAAVADPALHKAHVYWGNGTGGFTGYTSFVAGTSPKRLAIVDWNKDSLLDIAVTNTGSNDVTILFGDGIGGFPTSQAIAVGTTPLGIRVADLDNDGNSDLIVANSASAATGVTIVFGDGLGGVLRTSTLSLNQGGLDVSIADFNNDGFLDIVAISVGNHSAFVYQVFAGNGAGVFTQIGLARAGVLYSLIDKIAVADFNGDGNLDLAIAGVSSGSPSNYYVIPIIYGDGTGHFSTNPTVTVGTNPTRVGIDDFNHDGKSDALVINNGASTVSVFLGNGLGQLTSSQTISVGTQPSGYTTGDFNRDGKQDFIISNSGSANISIAFGNGDGTFITPVTNMAVTATPGDICQADFNKDGKLDIAVASSGGGGTLKTYFGNGSGVFAVSSTTSLSGTPYQMFCIDLNKDANVDVVLAVGQNIAVVLNDGSGGFAAAPTNVLTGAGVYRYSIAVGDFNSDGNLDLLGTRYYNGAIDRYLGDGTGNFVVSGSIYTHFDVTQLATGDFNGDGKIDLMVGNPNGGHISIHYGDGVSGFGGGQSSWISGNGLGRPGFGDLNGDGKIDIVAPNSADNNISIFLSQ